MNGIKINWHSLNADGSIREHGIVDLSQAIELADRYIQTGSEAAENENEDPSATTFGLCKSKTDYIEIEVAGPDLIFVEYHYGKQRPMWLQKFLGKKLPRLESVESRKQLIEKIMEFFVFPSEILAMRSADKPSDWPPFRSPLGNPRETSVAKRICGITLAWLLGSFYFCWTIDGLMKGGVYVRRFFSHRRDYYDVQGHPVGFWLVESISLAISLWIIWQGWKELKIVRRLRNEKQKAKRQ